MKKQFLLLVLALSISASGYSQKEKIISARVYYKVDKIIPPNKIFEMQTKIYESETLKEMVIGTVIKTKPVTSVLEFKNLISFFSISKKDAKEKLERKGQGINLSYSLGGADNEYYINLNNKEKFYKGKNMSFKPELVYFEKPVWELVEGEKKILGYTCKKAIQVDSSKNKRIVWYTEEIPYSYGPKNYFGLPGLILKMERLNDVFEATKIEINPKNIDIIKPTAKTKTTLKAKLKAFGKFMKEEN
jgi:GLPGLI family protein